MTVHGRMTGWVRAGAGLSLVGGMAGVPAAEAALTPPVAVGDPLTSEVLRIEATNSLGTSTGSFTVGDLFPFSPSTDFSADFPGAVEGVAGLIAGSPLGFVGSSGATVQATTFQIDFSPNEDVARISVSIVLGGVASEATRFEIEAGGLAFDESFADPIVAFNGNFVVASPTGSVAPTGTAGFQYISIDENGVEQVIGTGLTSALTGFDEPGADFEGLDVPEQPLSGLSGGTLSSGIGVRGDVQVGADTAASIQFSYLIRVPSAGSIALVGLAGVAAGVRRRR